MRVSESSFPLFSTLAARVFHYFSTSLTLIGTCPLHKVLCLFIRIPPEVMPNTYIYTASLYKSKNRPNQLKIKPYLCLSATCYVYNNAHELIYLGS